MSENENKKDEKKTKTPRTWSSTKVLDCASYFAVMFIAIALILRLIFQSINAENQSIAAAFQSIGECLAYIICIWLGFYWTMRKRGSGWNKHNVAWLVCYIVAVVVIVVVYIFATINL